MSYERSYEMGVVDARERKAEERAGKTTILDGIINDGGYRDGRATDKEAYREGWKREYNKR